MAYGRTDRRSDPRSTHDAGAPDTARRSDRTLGPIPSGSPYRTAKIVGALLNPTGADPGRESVTVFNSSAPLNVNGWSILDRNDKAESIEGVIPLGEAF